MGHTAVLGCTMLVSFCTFPPQGLCTDFLRCVESILPTLASCPPLLSAQMPLLMPPPHPREAFPNLLSILSPDNFLQSSYDNLKFVFIHSCSLPPRCHSSVRTEAWPALWPLLFLSMWHVVGAQERLDSLEELHMAPRPSSSRALWSPLSV